MKKLVIILLIGNILHLYAADSVNEHTDQKKVLLEHPAPIRTTQELSAENFEEFFKRHRNPGIPVEEIYPSGYFDRFNQPLMTPAEILYKKQYVYVPGIKSFYAMVRVSDYQGDLGHDTVHGIISGAREGAVQAVANNFNMVDERCMELIGDTTHGRLRFKKQSNSNMDERLRLAIRATYDKTEARAGDLPYIYLATSEHKQLCAILLPAHVQKEIPHDWVCKHESEEQCKTHSQRVLAHLAAVAQNALYKHKALVLVPYEIRPARFVCTE